MGGLVGIAYFVMASCTVICLASAWFSWRATQRTELYRQIVRRLHYWYAELYCWVIGKGLTPPMPHPDNVEQTKCD